MRHRDYQHYRDYPRFSDREHHPRVSIGLFFIVLGVALLVATNDLLDLGGVSRYFTWETAMIFIGVLLLLNLHFTGGLLLIAGGIWFLKDHIFLVSPEIFRNFYGPAVIVILGLSFILSSLFKRKT
jgi:glucose dehydrogenase